MSCPENEIPQTTETPLQLDFTQVFYHKECNAGPSQLTNLGLANGVDLETFAEAVDAKFGEGNGFNYNAASLDCLKERYIVTNQGQFVSAMDQEVCRLNTAFQSLATMNQTLTGFAQQLTALNQIGVVNNCGMNFDYNTPLKTVLQEFINAFCEFKDNLVIPQSPAISAITNSTIAWSLSGTLNHNLQAAVRVSGDNGNAISIRPDGIYANFSTAPVAPQTLAWNFNTNTLSISNGNSVVINFPGAQQLSLSGAVLNLSGGGGSVNLAPLIAPAFTQTSLSASASNQGIQIGTSGTANHTLSVGLKLSANPNNKASIVADGLLIEWPGVFNGLSYVGSDIKIGGDLDNNTEIVLDGNAFTFRGANGDTSFEFSQNGLKLFDTASLFNNTYIKVDTGSTMFQSNVLGTPYNYMVLNTYDGATLSPGRLFLGVATAPSTGLGSRTNIESSFGMRYRTSVAATDTITENDSVYVYLGQATPGAQTLTLPNPALSVGLNGGSTAWILHIKNFSKNAANTITTSVAIYTDDTTTVTSIPAGQSFIIAAINGKWVKIN